MGERLNVLFVILNSILRENLYLMSSLIKRENNLYDDWKHGEESQVSESSLRFVSQICKQIFRNAFRAHLSISMTDCKDDESMILWRYILLDTWDMKRLFF